MLHPSVLVIALGGLFLLPQQVDRQVDPVCPYGSQSRVKVGLFLDRHYLERPVGIGLSTTGDLIEILVDRDDETTWTILRTSPQGCSTIAMTGTDWFNLEPEKGDPI